MSEISINFTQQESSSGDIVKIVSLIGTLDESNVDEKSKIVYDFLHESAGSKGVVFDMSGLSYMNSKSIGYLTDWYLELEKVGVKLVIAGCQPGVADVLQIVGLLEIIKNYSSLDEAIADISL